MRKFVLLACLLALVMGSQWRAPPAHADLGFLCQYPGVGIGVNIGGVTGAFCDFPTEINGSHWHCQSGGVALGLGGAFTGIGGGANLGVAQAGQGIGGLSCNWRCPDNTDAPAPNPPGAWKDFLVPMNTTNYCRDHMTPNGFWSAAVLPTEGIPPAGEQPPPPGGMLPPQPVPPPQPAPMEPTVTATPPPPPPPDSVPGEPRALGPTPGEPNP